MGFACPVCEDPQADAGHLANHLAFAAILGDDAHGAWLDEHAPGWGEMDETELADVLGAAVEETEFPQVFEDTVGGLSESAESSAERSGALFDDGHPGAGQGRDGHPPWGDVPDVAGVDPAGPTDEETAAILAEAREMTREMRGVEDDARGADGPRAADDGDTEEGREADGARSAGSEGEAGEGRGADGTRGDDGRESGNENQ